MRAKLVKCQICHDWYSPFRSHCPNCGAGKLTVSHTLAGKVITEDVHVNAGNTSRPGIQIVPGFSRLYFSQHAVEICRILNDSCPYWDTVSPMYERNEVSE